MLAIGVRFLTGSASIQRWGSDDCEWPPHPGRLSMAMAAGLFYAEPLPGEPDQLWQAEREALGWLSSQKAPAIHAPPQWERTNSAGPDRWPKAFVPANDTDAVRRKGSLQSAPGLSRHRAERVFPRVWIDCDEHGEPRPVWYLWPDVDPKQLAAHRPALERLCSRVTRIGHPSTLVQAWLGEANVPAATLEPDDAGSVSMRLFKGGGDAIDRLRWPVQENGVPLPVAGRNPLRAVQRYRMVRAAASDADVSNGLFDSAIHVMRLVPEESRYRRLDIVTTLQLTHRLRKALIAQSEKELGMIPEPIHGHGRAGGPLRDVHLAYLPLPAVGARYGDGHLMGVAVAFPRASTDPGADEQRRQIMIALGHVQAAGLLMGNLGKWQLEEVGLDEQAPTNLRRRTWTAWPQGCRTWATVTPIALDRHSKAKDRHAYEREVADEIRLSCERAGLPPVVELFSTAVSHWAGVPAAGEFPRLQRKDGGARRQRHAAIVFKTPVVGPVMIGAGRYRGYGVCRPVVEVEP